MRSPLSVLYISLWAGGLQRKAAAGAPQEVRTAPVITGTRRCKLAVSVFKERAAKPVSNR